jgi:hypothetical protein
MTLEEMLLEDQAIEERRRLHYGTEVLTRRNNQIRKLTDREVATILHTLRIYQRDGPVSEARSCDECESLTEAEVDELRELISLDNLYIEDGEDDYEPTNYFGRDGKVRDRK